MTNINAGDDALLSSAPGASSSSGNGVPGPSNAGTMATAGVMSFKNFGLFNGLILAYVVGNGLSNFNRLMTGSHSLSIQWVHGC